MGAGFSRGLGKEGKLGARTFTRRAPRGCFSKDFWVLLTFVVWDNPWRTEFQGKFSWKNALPTGSTAFILLLSQPYPAPWPGANPGNSQFATKTFTLRTGASPAIPGVQKATSSVVGASKEIPATLPPWRMVAPGKRGKGAGDNPKSMDRVQRPSGTRDGSAGASGGQKIPKDSPGSGSSRQGLGTLKDGVGMSPLPFSRDKQNSSTWEGNYPGLRRRHCWRSMPGMRKGWND